jgi:pimeloyl-ACP methyl ester carboxylesterase
VLVGHSIGGLRVRRFASDHRADVVGMVLVDARSEYQDARLWSLLPAESLRAFEAGLRSNPEGLDIGAYRAGLAEVLAREGAP